MTDIPDTETAAASTPPAEVEVDETLVRRLLESQQPELAALSLELVAEGWDNFTFRLGTVYAVRLPRREVGAMLIEREQKWLAKLAPKLPLPTPVPKYAGAPGEGFPWAWSVLPWLEGEAADLAEPSADQAAPLVAFLRALHMKAPQDAPPNPVRGIPLVERAKGVEERLKRLEQWTDLDTTRIWPMWREALAAPISEDNVWLHGDLHARNVLVAGGAISGIIDWGDMTSGDPATDLASIWMLLGDKAARAHAISAYDTDDATWARAKGWAILFAAILLDTGLADTPRHAVMGERTFARLLADT